MVCSLQVCYFFQTSCLVFFVWISSINLFHGNRT
uniref:Uncharacterized protein n=1 Tax=Arundo donax TaxID=35708 RepID=A0A0A9HE13_ARUDO